MPKNTACHFLKLVQKLATMFTTHSSTYPNKSRINRLRQILTLEVAQLLAANNGILLINRQEDLFSQTLITVELGRKAHVADMFIYEKHQRSITV